MRIQHDKNYIVKTDRCIFNIKADGLGVSVHTVEGTFPQQAISEKQLPDPGRCIFRLLDHLRSLFGDFETVVIDHNPRAKLSPATGLTTPWKG